MSSDLQSTIVAIQQNNYISLAILTAVGYDYILVFPKEMEYIWYKSWSWVTIMFFFVRYCGLYNLAYTALTGSTFMPDSKMYVLGSLPSSHICGVSDTSEIAVKYFIIPSTGPTYSFSVQPIVSGREMNLIQKYMTTITVVMILRVWAMYNRSRLILGFFLAMLFIEVIAFMIGAVIYTNPKNESWITIQVLEYSFCVEKISQRVWAYMSNILQMTFGAVLCMVAIAGLLRQSVQMYHVTKQWQLSRYMSLLVNQGILYFLGIFLLNLMDLLSLNNSTSQSAAGWQFIIGSIVDCVPVYTLTPRFIIAIRELYAHDVRGRRGGGIDTGFGLSTLSSRATAGGPMVFAPGVQSEAMENLEPDGRESDSEGRRDIELVPREVGSIQLV